MAEPAGVLPPLPPAPEPPASEPPAEPVPGPVAEPLVEPNQVFFPHFRFVVRVFGLFRVLVFCRRPSFRSFFFGVSVCSGIFTCSFRRFRYLEWFFHATCPLGMLVCHRSIPCLLCFLWCYFL